ncbi:LADA_0E03444g1_1 [Lachancea dasiensis]|uniref:FMN reductase [NAD(P)H] n=1 Tax=Lachancea dasiensis TaxID=1072105 RepID=A0A1G4JBK4_9SACH|nr:LADA_0E03444g1_1 [Lachancea dasiensis]
MLIGIIIGSTRKPRAAPQIAQFVLDTIENSETYQKQSAKPTLRLIDLAHWNLPLYDESKVPSQIKSTEEYDHEHTRRWSREVQKYDAFIFVTPQYNWGYPAVLKNAIDFLYNEWHGKPAMVVTYGEHGGTKCNEQLTLVLQGIRMLPTDSTVTLAFPDRKTLVDAATGADLGLSNSSVESFWEGEKSQIEKAYANLLQIYSRAVQPS